MCRPKRLPDDLSSKVVQTSMHAAQTLQGDRMKTNKAVITLLFTLAPWLALVLGCSYLKKGTMSPSSGEASSGSKDYFSLRAGDSWKYRSTTSAGKQSEFRSRVLNGQIQ